MKAWIIFFLLLGAAATAGERHQNFDTDPNWDGVNNRPGSTPFTVKQKFGYSPTRNASSTPGEIGGLIAPAGELACYGKKIAPVTFNDRFSASGSMVVKEGGGNTLIGFYNPATANEWRTANSLVWRINGRGEIFHAHFEYATQKWRAGAGVIGTVDKKADRVHPIENPSGDAIYPWSMEYDPAGNNGTGMISVKFGEIASSTNLTPEHKADGALFDHFGILNVMKSADSPGEIWLGDLTVNGEKQDLSHDPHWEGRNNIATYETFDVRPWFNFGWSPTKFAGSAAGEIGGRFFRGDCREDYRLAYYGDRLSDLTLQKPIKASGRITMKRGVSDSTSLIAFFHHEHSIKVNPAQDNGIPKDCLGLAVEGPSAEGFYIYPMFRTNGDVTKVGFTRQCPRIYPDGTAHQWTLQYDPLGGEGRGFVTISLDGQGASMELPQGAKGADPHFDRFGFVTPWIDGNEQMVYFDDLTYTAEQD